MRFVRLSLLLLLCSLALADETLDQPDRVKFGIVNVPKVYESSLSRQQRALRDEEQISRLSSKEIDERKLKFEQRITRWQEIQKEIAAAEPDEASVLQKEANDVKAELKALEREFDEYRQRRERPTEDPSLRLHKLRMRDSLKAVENAAKARGVGYLFKAGDASSTLGEDDPVLYARELINVTEDAIAELRRMHGNVGVETEPIPRFRSSSPKGEALLEKAKFDDGEIPTVTKP